MIPKIIHQIWVGDKNPPEQYLESWKSLPGFKYKLWTEENLKTVGMLNQDKYDYFLDKKIYHGAADIARVEILFHEGGFYVDADTKRLKLLPQDWFDKDFFAVEAYESPKWKYRVTNGHMGSEAGGKLITEYRQQIRTAKKWQPCWSTIGGTMLTNIITEQFRDDPKTLILEPYTFYPTDMKGNAIDDPRVSEAYATHVWGSKNKELYT